MERSYLEDMLILFKRINGVRLMQDEMRYLQQDLVIIQNIPDVITDRIVRVNVGEIKGRIISTITANMAKIIRASEEVLQKLL